MSVGFRQIQLPPVEPTAPLNQRSHWGLRGCGGSCPPWHSGTSSPGPCGSVPVDLVLWVSAARLTRHLSISTWPGSSRRDQSGEVSVGVGHGGGAPSVQTSVFKSAEQSVLGRGNFKIRALGSILFYLFFFMERNDRSLMKKSRCSIVVISPPRTQFHARTFLTHFLHRLRLFPSRAVSAPSPTSTLLKLL